MSISYDKYKIKSWSRTRLTHLMTFIYAPHCCSDSVDSMFVLVREVNTHNAPSEIFFLLSRDVKDMKNAVQENEPEYLLKD